MGGESTRKWVQEYIWSAAGEIGSSGAAQLRSSMEEAGRESAKRTLYFDGRERIQKTTEVQRSWGNKVFH